MLTPLDFKNSYEDLIERMGYDDDEYPDYYYYHLEKVTKEDRFTEFQWNNPVKVASVIKANANRFFMPSFHHSGHECGTAHCIAGWAISLEKNDTNTVDVNVFDIVEKYNYEAKVFQASIVSAAAALLSDYCIPFFFLTYVVSGSTQTAEELLLKYFIEPILEEAAKESYELTQEVSEFINRAVCEVK